MCISEFTPSWSPCASPKSTNDGLQVHMIMASTCIFKLARLRPRSAPLGSLHHGLPVCVQICLVNAAKCISASDLISAYKCFSKLTRFRPPSPSLSSLDHGLPMHLQSSSVVACTCISVLCDCGLRIHLRTCSITASKCISKFTQ